MLVNLTLNSINQSEIIEDMMIMLNALTACDTIKFLEF